MTESFSLQPPFRSELDENRAMLAQHETLHEMLIRSATDKEFRKLLLTNSRAAFASYGIDLPEGKDIRFVENEHDLTIVLPNPIDGLTWLDESIPPSSQTT